MQPDITDAQSRYDLADALAEQERSRRFWLLMSMGCVLVALAAALILAAADELHVWSAALIVVATILGLFGVAAEK